MPLRSLLRRPYLDYPLERPVLRYPALLVSALKVSITAVLRNWTARRADETRIDYKGQRLHNARQPVKRRKRTAIPCGEASREPIVVTSL